MSNISDFSEESLAQRNPFTIITGYQKQSYSYGVTHISYTETIHPLVSLTWRWLGALFVPTVGDLAMDFGILGLKQHEYFFCTRTGKLLGNTRQESVKSAINIGKKKLDDGILEEALKYFNIAINLCKNALGNEQVELRSAGMEAERLKTHTRNKIESLEEEQRQEKVQSILRELNHSWNEAFLAESKGNTDHAKQLFATCYKLSNEINQSTEGNKFQIWIDITRLKLECNSLFNEAVNLQEQALNKLEEARSKCEEALEKRNDPGFENCMHVIENNIDEIKHLQISDQFDKS